MPTIRQMYRGVYSMYKSQYINGQIFRSTPNSNRSNSNSFKSVMTNWNTSNMLAGLSMINPNVRSVISGYDTAKNSNTNASADKAETYINLAREMNSNLFPNANNLIANSFKQTSIYNGNAFLNMNNPSNLGNLISLML